MFAIPTLHPALLYYDDAGISYVLAENFEAPGLETAGWDILGDSITLDATTPFDALQGSYYCRITDHTDSSGIQHAISPALNEMWLAFVFQQTQAPGGARTLFSLIGDLHYIEVLHDLTVVVDGTTYYNPVDTFSNNVWNYVWFHYRKKPSSIIQIAFSTDGIKPTVGTKYYALSDDNILTFDISGLNFFGWDTTAIDKIRLATMDIGSNFI